MKHKYIEVTPMGSGRYGYFCRDCVQRWDSEDVLGVPTCIEPLPAEKPNLKWHNRFLTLAEHISSWSKDPSTQAGSVIVDGDNRVISIGYNGLPRGVEDTKARLENREKKYKIILHAERNALLFANHSLEGCKLYVHPFMPCATCASMIIQAGISEVIAPRSDNPRWVEDFDLASEIFVEAGVKLLLL